MGRIKMHNWLVIWSPVEIGHTVNEMKVIDSWASDSRSIRDAIATMKKHFNDGEYKKHGKGQIRVVQFGRDWFWNG